MSGLLACRSWLPPLLLLALVGAGGSAARAAAVVTDQLVLPTAAVTERRGMTLPLPAGTDPAKPVWAAYELLAVSSDDSPKGNVIVSAALDSIATPALDAFVDFEARKLERSPPSGRLGTMLAAQIGERSDAELREMMGDGLYPVFDALRQGHGSILQGTRVRRYDPKGKADTGLVVSIQRAEGMQPARLLVTLGQGELPARFAEADGAQPTAIVGRAAIAVLVLGAVAITLRRLRRR